MQLQNIYDAQKSGNFGTWLCKYCDYAKKAGIETDVISENVSVVSRSIKDYINRILEALSYQAAKATATKPTEQSPQI